MHNWAAYALHSSVWEDANSLQKEDNSNKAEKNSCCKKGHDYKPYNCLATESSQFNVIPVFLSSRVRHLCKFKNFSDTKYCTKISCSKPIKEAKTMVKPLLRFLLIPKLHALSRFWTHHTLHPIIIGGGTAM